MVYRQIATAEPSVIALLAGAVLGIPAFAAPGFAPALGLALVPEPELELEPAPELEPEPGTTARMGVAAPESEPAPAPAVVVAAESGTAVVVDHAPAAATAPLPFAVVLPAVEPVVVEALTRARAIPDRRTKRPVAADPDATSGHSAAVGQVFQSSKRRLPGRWSFPVHEMRADGPSGRDGC